MGAKERRKLKRKIMDLLERRRRGAKRAEQREKKAKAELTFSGGS